MMVLHVILPLQQLLFNVPFIFRSFSLSLLLNIWTDIFVTIFKHKKIDFSLFSQIEYLQKTKWPLARNINFYVQSSKKYYFYKIISIRKYCNNVFSLKQWKFRSVNTYYFWYWWFEYKLSWVYFQEK